MTVLVAGGGLIGLAVAWRAARRGLDVTVVDEDPGAGASRAAAGMLAPLTEAAYGEEALRAFGRESLARFPAFLADLARDGGGPVALRTAGTLEVGFDADDMAELDRRHAYYAECGLPVERLTAGQARRREPALSPRVRGALSAPTDHSVEPRALHAALLAAAGRAGVHIVRSRIAALTVEDGRAAGVRLADGTVRAAGTVVLALGAWSGTLPGAPPLPVRPVKGQILRVRGDDGPLAGTVRALVRGRHVYLVPHDDHLVIGATAEERGFDPTVTAGAVHDLLRDAIEVVPEVAELELVETLARWRPGTTDNAPLLGPAELPGLVLATGHYRNGVLLTPATGDAIADLLATGRLPAYAEPFTIPRRSA